VSPSSPAQSPAAGGGGGAQSGGDFDGPGPSQTTQGGNMATPPPVSGPVGQPSENPGSDNGGMGGIGGR
jgi:hypothetical protein